jgi:hypothetical protein
MPRVLILFVSIVASSFSWADQFATYRAPEYSVILMTEKCSGGKTGISRLAFKKPVGGVVDGCWWVNGRDNPMVAWTGGQIQEFDASRVLLTPTYALAIEDRLVPGWTERKARPKQPSMQVASKQRARYEKEFSARLKACKAMRSCVNALYAAKARFYRQTLASR